MPPYGQKGKRKARPSRPHADDRTSTSAVQEVPATATIRAYEAQLTYGRAERYRELFELPVARDDAGGDAIAGSSGGTRSALVRLETEEADEGSSSGAGGPGSREIWVDR